MSASATRREFGAGAHAVLVFLVVYLPLEEFLLKWIPAGPLGQTGPALLRFVGEALLYLALASVIAAHKLRGLGLPATPIDRPFALFCTLALLSLAAGGGSWLAGLVNLRVLVRYVAAFYLAVYLRLGRGETRVLLRLLVLGALLQALLGIVQHLQGGTGAFWLPLHAELELAGVTREFTALTSGVERGAALGTTAHSVAFALWLLAGGVVALALALVVPARGLVLGAVSGACLVGIFFSYSRASLLAFLFAGVLVLLLCRRRPVAARILALSVLLLPPGIGLWLALGPQRASAGFVDEKAVAQSPLASVEQLFTAEYAAQVQASRLWVLRDVGRALVRSTGALGFGPDERQAKERVLASAGATLQRLIAYRAFEDVFWVALLAYYGFLGLGLFLLVLWRLAGAARALQLVARDELELGLAAGQLALLGATLPLTFVVRTFEFRAFAFAFWLLAGLVHSALKRGEVDAREVPDLHPAR